MIVASLRVILTGSLLLLLVMPATWGDIPQEPASNAQVQALDARADSLHVDSVMSRCVVEISTLLVEDMELDDTLDLLLETGGVEIGGCQIKLAIENSLIDIVDILPGELFDSCKWDMFDARQILSDDQSAPREVWQITVMSQGLSANKKPVCFGFNRPAALARLVLSSRHVTNVPDTTAEIFFYWESCRDNSLSNRSGESLVSENVEDVLPAVFATDREEFPTRHGFPSTCIRPGSRNAPLRQVGFRNGGVEFRFRLDQPSADSTSSSD